MFEASGIVPFDAVHCVPQSIDAVMAGNVVEVEIRANKCRNVCDSSLPNPLISITHRADAHNTIMETYSTQTTEDNHATEVTTESTTHANATKRGKTAKADTVRPKFERHEYAEIFPQLRKRSREELRTDIEQRGLLEPITLYDGKILDGWNRALVCTELNIELVTDEYKGDDPLGYVVSKNLKRRHLTAGQRAMIADSLAKMPRGGDRTSETSKPSIEGLLSREKAAERLNVSESSVERAHRVRTDAIPEVVAAVEAGEMSVSAADALSNATPEEQREVIALGDKKAISAAAKKVKPKRQHAKPNMCAQKIITEILNAMGVVGKIPALFDEIRENNLPHNEAELETLRVTVANDLAEIVAKVRPQNAEQVPSEPVTTLRLAGKSEKITEKDEPVPPTDTHQTVV